MTFFWFATPLAASKDWFEKFKSEATDSELHEFLYEMPKGGDLHLHLSGSGFPEWWYELAIASEKSGCVYYTKVRLNNCRLPNWDSFSVRPYHLMYRTLVAHNWEKLSKCEKDELLLVDDVFDSGRSVIAVIKELEEKTRANLPKTIKIATPWYKPSRNTTSIVPDFFIHETDSWLVFPHELSGLSMEEISVGKPEIARTLPKLKE